MCIAPADNGNTGAIVGGVVGGLVGGLGGVAGIVVFVIWFRKRKRSSRQGKEHMCNYCLLECIMWLTHFKQSFIRISIFKHTNKFSPS